MKPPRRDRRSRPTTWVIAGVVVVGAAVAAWWLWPADESAGETPPPQTKRQIATVTPQIVTNAVKATVKQKQEPEKPRPLTGGLPTYRDANGVLRFESGQRVYDPSRPATVIRQKVKHDFLAYPSERTIYDLLTLEPGESIVGEQRYDESFVEDFKKSLEKPITITEDDSVYSANVKEMVIEGKKILEERMKSGDDLAKILNEYRIDMENLMTYRSEVLDMVRGEIDREDFSENDVVDLVKAANLMLQDKGVKEINDNEFTRYGLIQEMRQALRAEKEANASNPSESQSADNESTENQNEE